MLDFLKYLLAVSIVTIMLAGAGWLVFWRTAGANLWSIQSGSMAPTLNKGDLVLSLKTSPSNLKAGDIITYHSPQNPDRTVTHRLIKIDSKQGFLITRGDSLSQLDAPVPYSALIGRVVKAAPKLGYAFDWLHKPFGLAAFVYLPALLVTIAEVRILAASYRYRPYQLI